LAIRPLLHSLSVCGGREVLDLDVGTKAVALSSDIPWAARFIARAGVRFKMPRRRITLKRKTNRVEALAVWYCETRSAWAFAFDGRRGAYSDVLFVGRTTSASPADNL